MNKNDNKTTVENVEVKKEKRWEPLEGRGGFFEICYETGEVRFKDSKKIVKNLRWNNEERTVKEYRTRKYNPMEEEVREAGRVYVGSKGDYLEWDYDNESCVLRKAKDKEEPEVEIWKKTLWGNREETKWEIVPGTKYKVSNLGRIVKVQGEEPISYKYGKDGTEYAILEGSTLFPLKYLVANAFLEEPKEPGMVLVHRNGVQSDNRVENLIYVPEDQEKYYYSKEIDIFDPETGIYVATFPNVAVAAEQTGIDPEFIYKNECNLEEEEEDYDE